MCEVICRARTWSGHADPADVTTTPVSGIGYKARMTTMNRRPESGLQLIVGGAYYELSMAVSRSETNTSNAGQEENSEQMLAKLLVAELSLLIQPVSR